MCQETYVCRDSVYNENLESLQTDLIRRSGLQLCRDFLTFFCNENSSTRSPCALFISRISRALRIWVSRKMCFIIDNSSCRRTCSRRDSKYSWQTSYNYNLWVYAYYWMSPIQLLRDPFWYSYFINSDLVWSSNWSLLSSRRDPSQFDDSTNFKNRTLELTPRIVTPYWISSDLPDTLNYWDELDIKLSLLDWSAEYAVHFILSSAILLLHYSWSCVGLREDSECPRPRKYSNEVSIFRNSPSLRSESALLSAET